MGKFVFSLSLWIFSGVILNEQICVLQGGAAVWCIGFQKIQGQGITILGGMNTLEGPYE